MSNLNYMHTDINFWKALSDDVFINLCVGKGRYVIIGLKTLKYIEDRANKLGVEISWL